MAIPDAVALTAVAIFALGVIADIVNALNKRSRP